MNCIEFDQIVIDLGREVPVDAETRREALDHAAGCGTCAVRLRRERSLAIALRLWADSDLREGAPERVEKELQAAFVLANRRRRIGRRWLWASGAAAVVVLTVVALGVKLSERSRPATPGSRQTRQAVPSQQQQMEIQRPEFAVRENSSVPAEQTPTRAESSALSNHTSAASAGLLAPDFVPMPGADQDIPIAEGEVVRVEMPGAELARAGVPVATNFSGQPIVADVLLDQNGTARAIRVVSAVEGESR